MINQRISLSEATGAYMDTYILEPTEHYQAGARRPVVVVCPGGGYLRTSDQEAEPVAMRFNTLGYHAVVVRYTCGEKARWPRPMVELAEAIRILRENANEWLIRTDKIAICGFSAGAHLSAMLSCTFDKAAEAMGVDAETVRPNAAILGYPVIDLNVSLTKSEVDYPYLEGDVDPEHPERSVPELFKPAVVWAGDRYMIDFTVPMYKSVYGTAEPTTEQKNMLSPNYLVSEKTCPTFIWNTFSDELVPAINSIRYANALYEKDIPCEYHMFAAGPHGLSLADDTVAVSDAYNCPKVAKWFELCAGWLKGIDFTPKMQ